ncbi:MAG: hypothetical protein RI996_433 [Candidatus Parcubacteria bacterium]|jgi:hypothetical protein
MQSPSYLFLYILIALSVLLISYVFFLHRKISRFLTGSSAQNLEGALIEDRKRVAELLQENKILRSRLDVAEKKLTQSVRAVETVRFNPFADQGSNQSFATTLVDETGSGVMLSSLYSRSGVSIFAKPLKNFTSNYELTAEEKESIEITKKNQYDK